MHRVAIFVDAGYLFAQGSAALTGRQRQRADLVLNPPVVIQTLKQLAAEKAPACSCLRIYWYDGALGGNRLTTDQAGLADLDDVKMRLGFINSAGQQKGVDSLIVTDLIELARQKAICDAVLLSGDEDVRVGVQIAQNYGVRVHVLGIVPTRGNQSRQLVQEADTTHEWQRETIALFLSERAIVRTGAAKAKGEALATDTQSAEAALEKAAEKFVALLEETDIAGLESYWTRERGLPSDLDRKLLPEGRDAIGRNLDVQEKRFIRTCVQRMVTERIKSTKKTA